MNIYPSYKESGVEWIGETPSEWELKKIKYIFWERKELNKPIKTKNLISLTLDKGVIPHSEKGPGGNKPKEDLTKYKLVYPDDIVVNSMNVVVGSIGISNYYGVVSPVYYMLSLINNNDQPLYFHHLFRTQIFQRSLVGLGNGILVKHSESSGKMNTIRMRIPMDKLNQQLIPYPPLQEQQQISDYLDYKTSKINTLIEKTQQKIELLKEQRTSLINTTVTKGLNPNVEMKDSGVEWIGDVPSSWNVIRLVNLGVFSKGKGIVKDDIKSEGHPCVRGGEVYTQYNRIFNRTVSYISDDTIEKTVLVKYKSILFSGDGETLEEIGKCIVYNGSEDIYIGGGINVFTPIDTVNHIFLSYSLNSEYVVFQKSREGRGQIVVHIYQKQLREIRLSIPPPQEQQQIVDYLDKETSKIDKLVDMESKRIGLLKEYRQSLISDVVTGKVDVRDGVLV